MCINCKIDDEAMAAAYNVLAFPVVDMQSTSFGTDQRHDPEYWLTGLEFWTEGGYVAIQGEFKVVAVQSEERMPVETSKKRKRKQMLKSVNEILSLYEVGKMTAEAALEAISGAIASKPAESIVVNE